MTYREFDSQIRADSIHRRLLIMNIINEFRFLKSIDTNK